MQGINEKFSTKIFQIIPKENEFETVDPTSILEHHSKIAGIILTFTHYDNTTHKSDNLTLILLIIFKGNCVWIEN